MYEYEGRRDDEMTIFLSFKCKGAFTRRAGHGRMRTSRGIFGAREGKVRGGRGHSRFWVFLSIDGFPFYFLICPSFRRSRNEMNVFMVETSSSWCYFHCCCHSSVDCCNARVL